jgi:hypothetical protein
MSMQRGGRYRSEGGGIRVQEERGVLKTYKFMEGGLNKILIKFILLKIFCLYFFFLFIYLFIYPPLSVSLLLHIFNM